LRRRRLVKGSAALPLVLTLASGAQAAASSLSCIERGPVGAGAPQRFTNEPDEWYRQRLVTGTVQAGTLDATQATDAYCVENAVVPAPPDGVFYSACADGQQNGIGAWVYADGERVSQGPIRAQSPYEFAQGTNAQYGLIFVDNAGNVTSLTQGGLTPYAAATSCMCSLGIAGVQP
jgi:hypothetical protein